MNRGIINMGKYLKYLQQSVILCRSQPLKVKTQQLRTCERLRTSCVHQFNSTRSTTNGWATWQSHNKCTPPWDAFNLTRTRNEGILRPTVHAQVHTINRKTVAASKTSDDRIMESQTYLTEIPTHIVLIHVKTFLSSSFL